MKFTLLTVWTVWIVFGMLIQSSWAGVAPDASSSVVKSSDVASSWQELTLKFKLRHYSDVFADDERQASRFRFDPSWDNGQWRTAARFEFHRSLDTSRAEDESYWDNTRLVVGYYLLNQDGFKVRPQLEFWYATNEEMRRDDGFKGAVGGAVYFELKTKKLKLGYEVNYRERLYHSLSVADADDFQRYVLYNQIKAKYKLHKPLYLRTKFKLSDRWSEDRVWDQKYGWEMVAGYAGGSGWSVELGQVVKQKLRTKSGKRKAFYLYDSSHSYLATFIKLEI